MKYSLIIFFVLISASLHAEENSEVVAKVESENKTLSGEEVFTTFCADACHQAPDRSRLNANQWRVVLNTMQTRMTSSGRVPLNEGQTLRLLEYLSVEN